MQVLSMSIAMGPLIISFHDSYIGSFSIMKHETHLLDLVINDNMHFNFFRGSFKHIETKSILMGFASTQTSSSNRQLRPKKNEAQRGP